MLSSSAERTNHLIGTVNAAILVILLARHLGGLAWRSLAAAVARSLAAALVMAPLVHFIAASVDWADPAPLVLKALVLAAAIGAGVGIYVAASYLLGGREVAAVAGIVRERFGKESSESRIQNSA